VTAPAAGRFQWERELRDDPDLLPSTKLVALVLATYANRDGSHVRPGRARLAAATGLSERSVSDHLGALHVAGWIHAVVAGGSRNQTTSEYRLLTQIECPPWCRWPTKRRQPTAHKPMDY
jgi:hypothetical protein